MHGPTTHSSGRGVVFGNADRAETLHAAGIERARLAVITYPTLPSIEQLLRVARYSPLRQFYQEEKKGMLQRGLAKIRRKRPTEESSR